MKTILVSFFISNNLGDIALSNAMENLIQDNGNVEIIKFDFLTAQKIECISSNKCNAFVVEHKELSKPAQLKELAKKVLPKAMMTIAQFKVKRLISNPMASFEEDLKQADQVIIGGGNMLMDLTASWPDILQGYSLLCQKYNVPYDIQFVGVGPIFHKRSERILKEIVNKARYVSVRGSKSKDLIESLKVNVPVILTVDPVFSLDIDTYATRTKRIAEMKSNEIVHIGICVIDKVCFNNSNDFESYIKTLISFIVNMHNNYKITLFSTEKMDYEAIHMIKGHLGEVDLHDAISIERIDSIAEIINLYNRLDFLIGGRMHSLIFAQKCLLPFIGVIWQEKLVEFSELTKSKSYLYKIDQFEKLDFATLIETNSKDLNKIDEMKQVNEELRFFVTSKEQRSVLDESNDNNSCIQRC